MKVCDILKSSKEIVLSFEFFPPKKEENWPLFWNTVNKLKKWRPDFVSVTYGAGGSTHDKSIELSIDLKNQGFTVVTHLTCISTPVRKLIETLTLLMKEGIENMLALRGDIPKDYVRDENEEYFSYAWQLVELAAKFNHFCIGVAGYPEGHLESKSIEEDIYYLKFKVDKGAHFIITQLFFDNIYFYDFVERAQKAGITVPIIPGIMPISSYNQIIRFTELCGARIPRKLLELLEEHKDNPDAIKNIGIEYAIGQCEDLVKNGVRALHFYTLNTNESVDRILEGLRIRRPEG